MPVAEVFLLKNACADAALLFLAARSAFYNGLGLFFVIIGPGIIQRPVFPGIVLFHILHRTQQQALQQHGTAGKQQAEQPG